MGTAEDLLLQVIGGGSLDEIEAAAKEFNKRQASHDSDAVQAEARVFADCFDTEAGRKCLALMVRKTLWRQPSPAEYDCTSIEEFALVNARRQGVQNLMFQIMDALDIARGETTEKINAD